MYLEMDGCSVAYEIIGAEGEKVVLLHGWGCDRSLMRPVADSLRNDHQVLLIDLPGHGESGRPPEPWGIPEYAHCIKQLLQALSWTPCAAVAHSFGCRIVTYLAAADPSFFSRIVMTGAAGIKPPASSESQNKQSKYQSRKRIIQRFGRIPGFSKLSEKMLESLIQKYGSADYKALDQEMRKTFVKVIGLDLTDLYPRIQQSTLLVWGESDTETPLWMGQKMEKLIPDAGLVIFENGSHFAYLEQIGRFNAILKSFL